MNLSRPKIKLSDDARRAAVLKSQEANEKIFRLVVKIIRWETESTENQRERNISKITHDEWNKYTKHLLGIYQPDSRDKIKDKLKKTYEAIKGNGGFE